MNFRKLFFYSAAISLTALTNIFSAYAASHEPQRPRDGAPARADTDRRVEEELRLSGMRGGKRGRVDFGDRNPFLKARHQAMFRDADQLLEEEEEGKAADKVYSAHKRDVERARLRAKVAEGRYAQADKHRVMFDQADDLLKEERHHKREVERARLRAKIAHDQYAHADKHRLMFDQADPLLREEEDRRFGKEYSEAKRYWQEAHRGQKKKFWETEKKFHARLYNQMLDDLESRFPDQVAAEREMREAR